MKLLTLSFLVLFCTTVTGDAVQRTRTTPGSYGPPIAVGKIQSREISESSGLAASRMSAGVYWTHNDSGDGPFIYCLKATGQTCGTWRVANAEAQDWEDIASGPGPVQGRSYLYIGDIGDNDDSRSEVVVYRISEPTVSTDSFNSTRKRPEKRSQQRLSG